MSKPIIRWIANKDIDRTKWDRCNRLSGNSSVYINCWFLDIVCPSWTALVWGDYEYIMPLPFRQRFGIPYLAQPIYAQQFGIFPEPEGAILAEMLEWVASRFKYIRLSLNPSNSSNRPDFLYEARKNYTLSLNLSHQEITERFAQNTRRNIRKAKQAVVVRNKIGATEYINLKSSFPGVEDNPEVQKTLSQIIATAILLQKGTVYGAYSSGNDLCAAAFFLFDSKRVYYLNAVSSGTGKELSAMYAIVDQFIQDHAGQNLILDFEGSQNPGIARFYEGFGAGCEIYQHIYRNILPWPLRILKK
jgi:lipid II:glycine glycyltransferase (peptidoglycan interpeptide bridge formation enzyme)